MLQKPSSPRSTCSIQWHLILREASLTLLSLLKTDIHTTRNFVQDTLINNHYANSMSSSLQDIWDSSASQPFEPTISKSQQFTVGFALLFAALVLTGLFGLST